MKLVVFCLFAVSCWSASAAVTDMSKSTQKLKEVLREVGLLKNVLLHNGLKLKTPPQNVENCCCGSALRCFQANVMQLNVTNNVIQKKLRKSLLNPLTVSGLNLCDSGATHTPCQTCESYPEEDTMKYVDRLETLINRALAKLMS